MGFFSSSSGRGNRVLILDIRSSSVGGALVEYKEPSHGQGKTLPSIIYTTRKDLIFQEDLNFEIFLEMMLKSLEEVVVDVLHAKLGAPSAIYCVLASPWYASQTRVVTLAKNTPFIFTKKFAQELIDKEIALFQSEQVTKYQELGQAVRTIEEQTIEVALNGYSVKDPIGKQARELSMTLFLSFSPEVVIKAIENSIHKHFHNRHIAYYTFAFASFITLRDLFMNEDTFLLVDVGGEITDISIVKNDLLLQSVSFPFGKNFLLRKISKALGKSGGEALSLYRMYADMKLEKNTIDQLAKILAEARVEWLTQFQHSLEDISKEFTLPDTIFMTADRDTVSWFVDTLHAEEFHQYTSTKSTFKIVTLTPQLVSEYIHFGSDMPRDLAIMLETIFLTRIKGVK
ncbi:hypothetical protein IPF86_03610 [Candidatus Nomurabacteria bacterium]|nr:MAG: hypothetical protein IPF86_03610 [Candidatus Nomurabacteria bacterium]